jgi:hypothetical protein
MNNKKTVTRVLSLVGLLLAFGSTTSLAADDQIELNISPKNKDKETVQVTETRTEVFNQSGWSCSALKPRATAGIVICNNGPAEVALTVDCTQPKMTVQSMVLATSEDHQLVATMVLSCLGA